MYKISEAAIRANLPVKTVRYYGDIGLVTPAGRSDALVTGSTQIPMLPNSHLLVEQDVIVFRLISVVSC